MLVKKPLISMYQNLQITNQLRWDKSDLISYYNRSYDLLASIDVRCLEHGHAGIEHCYESIVHSLQVAAVDTIPPKKWNFYKFWWDSELGKLKELSIDAHTVWKQAGKPKCGPIYEAKRISHANYKLAVNRKRDASQNAFTNDLHESLLRKDMISFWKSWRCKFGHNKPAGVVEGLRNPNHIANKFADVFEAASKPNNPMTNAAAKLDFENRLMNYEFTSSPAAFTVYEVEKCIGKLKHGKAQSSGY